MMSKAYLSKRVNILQRLNIDIRARRVIRIQVPFIDKQDKKKAERGELPFDADIGGRVRQRKRNFVTSRSQKERERRCRLSSRAGPRTASHNIVLIRALVTRDSNRTTFERLTFQRRRATALGEGE